MDTDQHPEMVVYSEGGLWFVDWYDGGHVTVSPFNTRAEAEAWLNGYETGARENM